MALFKFLFVLALAVPLGVLMRFFINKLLDEFKSNLKKGKDAGVYEKPHNTYNNKKETGRAYAQGQHRTEPPQNYGNPGYAGRAADRPQPVRDSARANFENSRMKQKYQESLRENSSDTYKNSSKKTSKTGAFGTKSSANKEKSKRQRRAERKKNRSRDK